MVHQPERRPTPVPALGYRKHRSLLYLQTEERRLEMETETRKEMNREKATDRDERETESQGEAEGREGYRPAKQ